METSASATAVIFGMGLMYGKPKTGLKIENGLMIADKETLQLTAESAGCKISSRIITIKFINLCRPSQSLAIHLQ